MPLEYVFICFVWFLVVLKDGDSWEILKKK